MILWAERVGSRAVSRPGIAAAGVAGAALLVVPVASAVTHFDTADQRGNRFALHYAQDVLGPLAPNALLVMRSDENFTSMYCAQNVAHFRRDVVALDAELLKLAVLRRPGPPSAPGDRDPVQLVRRRRGEPPRSTISCRRTSGGVPSIPWDRSEEKDFEGLGFDQLKEGFALRLADERLGAGRVRRCFAGMPLGSRGFHYPERSYPGRLVEAALGGATTREWPSTSGYALQSGSVNAPLAERMFRTAIRLDPNLAPAYRGPRAPAPRQRRRPEGERLLCGSASSGSARTTGKRARSGPRSHS